MNEAAHAESSLRRLMALAPKIRDHKDFETKLTSAPPHLREIIYEACKPFLRFKAKPLDKYVVGAKQMAERERLPTIDAQGILREYETVEVLLSAELSKFSLTLKCHKCSKQETLHAIGNETNVDVVIRARRKGWVHNYMASPAHEICPSCPTSLRAGEFDA